MISVLGAGSNRGLPEVDAHEVHLAPLDLSGTLRIPHNAFAIVIFAHGSGSGRFSPRNVAVAEALNRHGIATLLFDLLSPEEEAANARAKVFDIPLLAARLESAVAWVDRASVLQNFPIGLFGASTGAAAALVAAARLGRRIGAVVSRGGRPDMAGRALPHVLAPTLLIVGGADYGVIELNQDAYKKLTCDKSLEIVPGATHLFSEPGALDQVTNLAQNWFARWLPVRAHAHA
jgi:putative phosphoribosyl transferase